jgi:hypothetical protein
MSSASLPRSSLSTAPSESTFSTHPATAYDPREHAPPSLSTYTRSMHRYTASQMKQMRAAIAKCAQDAREVEQEGKR